MLKQLLDDNRIFSALVCVLVFIASGLLYLQTVKQKGRRAVQHTQENVQQMQTPPPETQPAESGSAVGLRACRLDGSAGVCRGCRR